MKRQIIAWVMVCVLLAAAFSGCSKPEKEATAALTSEHFSINRSEFAYFFNECYYSFCERYSSYVSYFFDTGKPLNEQKYSDGYAESVLGESYDGTWFEYFTDQAVDLSRQVLQFCEAAIAEGMNFSAEDDSAANHFGEVLKTAADSRNQSLSEYILSRYGSHATYDGLVSACRLSSFAGRYMMAVKQRVTGGVTDAQIEEYYNENIGDFETFDYYQYPLIAEKTGDTEKDQAAIRDIAATAEKLRQAKDLEEFLGLIRNDLWKDAFEDTKKEYYDMLYSSLSKSYEGEELESEINRQLTTLTESLLDRTLNAAKKTNVTYNQAVEFGLESLAQWIYNGTAKPGDVRSIISEDENQYYIVLICLSSVPERDENELYRVGIAVFDSTEKGVTASQLVSEQFRSQSGKTAELLKQIGEEKGALVAETVETYFDGYYAAAYGLAELDDWFDEAKPGKVGDLRITTEQNSVKVTYFIVAYMEAFVDVGWRYKARQVLEQELCDEWYATHSDRIDVTVNKTLCYTY